MAGKVPLDQQAQVAKCSPRCATHSARDCEPLRRLSAVEAFRGRLREKGDTVWGACYLIITAVVDIPGKDGQFIVCQRRHCFSSLTKSLVKSVNGPAADCTTNLSSGVASQGYEFDIFGSSRLSVRVKMSRFSRTLVRSLASII